MADRVLLEIRDDIACVTLNRPDKHNGLDLEMVTELREVARDIRRDRALRAVILRGAGTSFCAGLDFARVTRQPAGILKAFLRPIWKDRNAFQDCCWVWRELPVPVIAAIRGHCYGGGLQIALAADFRYARPDARLSVMEIKWGLIPDLTGTKTLAELVRMDVAKELVMTGRVVAGSEAAELGLVTRICEDPEAEAWQTAGLLREKSPDALAGIKDVLHGNWSAGEADALRRERAIQARLLVSRNQREAMQAGLKKRTPTFKPRQFDFS